MRIFRADVDVALAGADRDAGDGHAFDHHEGIALHDHAVGEGAAVAFVGVADDVFLFGAGLRHGLPFYAGREAGAAAAAQPGRGDVGEDGVRRQRQRARQALVAVMGAVILQRARIDHAAAGEGQAGLPLQPGNVIRDTKPQGMRAARDHRIEHGIGRKFGHRAERDASLRGRDLDHRLQPIKPARAGSDDLDFNAAFGGGQPQHQRDFVGSDRDRTRIP